MESKVIKMYSCRTRIDAMWTIAMFRNDCHEKLLYNHHKCLPHLGVDCNGSQNLMSPILSCFLQSTNPTSVIPRWSRVRFHSKPTNERAIIWVFSDNTLISRFNDNNGE